jgi:type IV secretory pathway VirB10-like protein
MSESSPPVASPTPPPARRLHRLTVGGAVLLAALFVTVAALVITSPNAKTPHPGAAEPKDQRSAEANFMNNPPRRPSGPLLPDPERDTSRIEALLRAAQQPQRSPSGPLALGSPSPGAAPDSLPAPNPRGIDALGAQAEAPPPGVYRPYYIPRPAQVQANIAKPSWQAAFASSLSPSSAPTVASSGPLAASPPPPPSPPSSTGQAEPKPEAAPAPIPSRVTASSFRTRSATLKAGTVLNAILLTAVSTQIEGDAVAFVTTDVFGADGALLLPRGARLIGSYKNRVALGDSRLAIAWDRILLNGRTYEIPGLPSTSPDGAAGASGEVNNHTALVFGRAAALSLIGAGAQLGQPRQSRLGATLSNGEVVSGSASQQLSQAASEYLNRAINVTPTISIPAGSRVTVLVPYDLELPSS